ncbi:hypothetical protein [Streptomyces sp. KR55]|uniref:hypothetical protein n=1 Tax=Streptomyces sp. KR55 TaxID=3457425 RepID=UPI003FD2BD09
MLLDDRSYTNFTLRHMPHRPGLIVAAADPNATAYPRAAAIGAEAVLRAGQDLSWLHLRLHAATDCRYARWEALLTGPPPPEGSYCPAVIAPSRPTLLRSEGSHRCT